MRRCQLLGGANDLLDYISISETMDNSDGGTRCCTACYGVGYK